MTVSINANKIPTIAAGSLFSRFKTDETFTIRWITPTDPVVFFCYNRPLADIAVRQLAIAKSLDAVGLAVSHLTLFPFIIQAQIGSGSDAVDLPQAWIWDMHASLPIKWENLRLAKAQRISGSNTETTEGLTYTGKIRLIFTANIRGTSEEKAIFYVDYQIDSPLTYQVARVTAATTDIDADALDDLDIPTIGGHVEFRTLDTSDASVQALLNLVAPPTGGTDQTGDGLYDTPATYEIVDSPAGGTTVSDDFALASVSHGTGLLTPAAWAIIPAADSSIQNWIEATNYPFGENAPRVSTTSVTIPTGLFKEFSIVAPASEEPTGDTTGLNYPVFISRIEALGSTEETLRVTFATYLITDDSPVTTPVDFATLDLLRTGTADTIIAIEPLTDLVSTDHNASRMQGFGRGHVVLSAKWDDDPTSITDFFDSFSSLVVAPREIEFTVGNTRLSSFAVSRVPKYTPTKGQAQALVGTTSSTEDPSSSNRFVVEQDQGLGNQVDLEAVTSISPHAALARYGHTGSLCHRMVVLEVNYAQADGTEDLYENYILPRLTVLLGRAPQFGDFWYDGTRLKFMGTSGSWQTP